MSSQVAFNTYIHVNGRKDVVWEVKQCTPRGSSTTLTTLELRDGVCHLQIFIDVKQVKDLMGTLATFLASRHYAEVAGENGAAQIMKLNPKIGDHLDALLHDLMYHLHEEPKGVAS